MNYKGLRNASVFLTGLALTGCGSEVSPKEIIFYVEDNRQIYGDNRGSVETFYIDFKPFGVDSLDYIERLDSEGKLVSRIHILDPITQNTSIICNTRPLRGERNIIRGTPGSDSLHKEFSNVIMAYKSQEASKK